MKYKEKYPYNNLSDQSYDLAVTDFEMLIRCKGAMETIRFYLDSERFRHYMPLAANEFRYRIITRHGEIFAEFSLMLSEYSPTDSKVEKYESWRCKALAFFDELQRSGVFDDIQWEYHSLDSYRTPEWDSEF